MWCTDKTFIINLFVYSLNFRQLIWSLEATTTHVDEGAALESICMGITTPFNLHLLDGVTAKAQRCAKASGI